MHFPRMPIEAESPEQLGYEHVRFNLTESSVRVTRTRWGNSASTWPT